MTRSLHIYTCWQYFVIILRQAGYERLKLPTDKISQYYVFDTYCIFASKCHVYSKCVHFVSKELIAMAARKTERANTQCLEQPWPVLISWRT